MVTSVVTWVDRCWLMNGDYELWPVELGPAFPHARAFADNSGRRKGPPNLNRWIYFWVPRSAWIAYLKVRSMSALVDKPAPEQLVIQMQILNIITFTKQCIFFVEYLELSYAFSAGLYKMFDSSYRSDMGTWELCFQIFFMPVMV